MPNILVRRLKRTSLWRRFQRGILERAAREHADGIEYVARSLRGNSLIDWDRYAAITGCLDMGFDPAFHYVLTGEREGYAKQDFDADFYAARYDDVRASETNRLLHYLTQGRRDGRYATAAQAEASIPVVSSDGKHPTIFVIDHQASRSGAPILGWNIIKALKSRYFVVSIVFAGGDLMEAFEAVADVAIACPKLDQDRKPSLAKVFAAYKPIFAVVNSIDCCAIATDLAGQNIPFVTLVQEFAGVYGSRNENMRALYAGSSAIVCASEIILRGSLQFYPFVPPERCFIQPQGRSEIPPITSQELRRKSASTKQDNIAAVLRPPNEPRRFVVAGLGTVDIRKAVDLFLATATSVSHEEPDRNITFVWIGHRPPRSDDDSYSMYIEEQLARSDNKGRLLMLPATADIDTVYEEIDVLYLCSRLDPMPNICIDAAMAKTPVICFENATGFADLLKQHDDLRTLVLPYLDIGGAARLIQRLAAEPELAMALGQSIRRMAETTFDMGAYVGLIEELGLAAANASAPMVHPTDLRRYS